MKKFIILSALLTTVVACTTSQSGKSFNTHTADFSKASDEELCIVYGYRVNRSGEAKSELIKRKVFTNTEWNQISQHQVSKGMSECAVKAAYAISYKKVLTTTFNNGDKGRSYIYNCTGNNVPHCPYTKIDMVNGKVTSVSSVQKI